MTNSAEEPTLTVKRVVRPRPVIEDLTLTFKDHVLEATLSDGELTGQVNINSHRFSYGIPTEDLETLEVLLHAVLNRPAPVEAERVATVEEIMRHAKKQGISWVDSWSYFERQGYDMSQAVEQDR